MNDYVYFIENLDEGKYRENSLLFGYIRDKVIPEENIYADKSNDKSEWGELLKRIQPGDQIILRSLIDLADSRDQLLDLLNNLDEDGILLYSVEEPAVSGSDYAWAVYGVLKILKYYSISKQKQGYANALRAGKVGRKPKTEEVEKALRLFDTKSFKIAEIEELSGVSASTLYRAVKERDAGNP